MAERMAAAKVLYSTPLVADLSFETNSLMLKRTVFRPHRVEYQPLKRIQFRGCHGDDHSFEIIDSVALVLYTGASI